MTLREVFQHNVTKTAALMSSLTHGGKVKRERGSDYFWGGWGGLFEELQILQEISGFETNFSA